MNKQNQNGSVLVVVSAIIIAIILGVVGAVAWKNITNNDQSTTNTSNNSTEKEEQLKEAAVDSSFPMPISWKYPKEWKVESTGSGPKSQNDTAVQSFTLTSPSSKYSVLYQVGMNGGRGGACDPTAAGTVKYIRKESVSGLKEAAFVEFIGDSYRDASLEQKPTNYYFRSGITSDTPDVQAAKIGTTNCFFGIGGLTLDKEANYDLLGASIRLNDFTEADGTNKLVEDVDQLKTALNTDEYKQAVAILLSTTTKK